MLFFHSGPQVQEGTEHPGGHHRGAAGDFSSVVQALILDEREQ